MTYRKDEPKTDAEFEAALQKLGYKLIVHSSEEFSVQRIETGTSSALESTDRSNALFEAWHLVKD